MFAIAASNPAINVVAILFNMSVLPKVTNQAQPACAAKAAVVYRAVKRYPANLIQGRVWVPRAHNSITTPLHVCNRHIKKQIDLTAKGFALLHLLASRKGVCYLATLIASHE